jgi:ankyrin repeat protein
LFQAVQNNQLSNVQKLLKSGVDVNARDARGATPLMNAAVYASPEVIPRCLPRGPIRIWLMRPARLR